MEPIGKELTKYQLPNGTRETDRHIPSEFVDSLADELVCEYDNAGYRKWYCGVINKFGVARVLEWRGRAKEGRVPGRLFTTYVNQAGGYRSQRGGGE